MKSFHRFQIKKIAASIRCNSRNIIEKNKKTRDLYRNVLTDTPDEDDYDYIVNAIKDIRESNIECSEFIHLSDAKLFKMYWKYKTPANHYPQPVARHRGENNELHAMPGFFFCPMNTEGLSELSLNDRVHITAHGQGLYSTTLYDTNDPSEMADLQCYLDNNNIPTHKREGIPLPGFGTVPLDLFEFTQPQVSINTEPPIFKINPDIIKEELEKLSGSEDMQKIDY